MLQPGRHRVIDAVTDGISARLKELYDVNVTIRPYNGNFNPSAMDQAAVQMAASDADLLIAVTTPASQSLVGANAGSKNLVFTFVTDPSKIGYSGPGSVPRTTGLVDKVAYDETLQVIKAFLPNAHVGGYLVTTSEDNAVAIHKEFERKVPSYGLTLKTANIRSPSDVSQAAATLASNVDFFLVGGDHALVDAIGALIQIARANNKPVFCVDRSSIEQGCVGGASINYTEMGRRTGEVAAFVLSGAKPERLPVEEFQRFERVVSESAAKSFGLAIPPNVRSAAVIIQ